MSDGEDWTQEASNYSGGGASLAGVNSPRGGASDSVDRTAQVAAQLKNIYKKSVLPVEKRFKYDYFYESPFLTDVEFDGKSVKNYFHFSFACFIAILETHFFFQFYFDFFFVIFNKYLY